MWVLMVQRPPTTDIGFMVVEIVEVTSPEDRERDDKGKSKFFAEFERLKETYGDEASDLATARTCMVIVHTHSDCGTDSPHACKHDIEMTVAFCGLGMTGKMPLLDHVIISESGRTYSLAMNGILALCLTQAMLETGTHFYRGPALAETPADGIDLDAIRRQVEDIAKDLGIEGDLDLGDLTPKPPPPDPKLGRLTPAQRQAIRDAQRRRRLPPPDYPTDREADREPDPPQP